MTNELIRLVLEPEAEAGRFDAWARGLGWSLFDELPRGHNSLYERVFKPEGEGKSVAAGYCEDHTLGVRFVWLLGAPEHLAGLAAAVPHQDRSELLGRAGSSDLASAIDAMRALTWLEAIMPISAELLALFERFAEHESPVVRRIAIHLGWVGAWGEIAPIVERRQAADAALADAWGKLAAALRKAGEQT
jgi:hypothetical protein